MNESGAHHHHHRCLAHASQITAPDSTHHNQQDEVDLRGEDGIGSAYSTHAMTSDDRHFHLMVNRWLSPPPPHRRQSTVTRTLPRPSPRAASTASTVSLPPCAFKGPSTNSDPPHCPHFQKPQQEEEESTSVGNKATDCGDGDVSSAAAPSSIDPTALPHPSSEVVTPHLSSHSNDSSSPLTITRPPALSHHDATLIVSTQKAAIQNHNNNENPKNGFYRGDDDNGDGDGDGDDHNGAAMTLRDGIIIPPCGDACADVNTVERGPHRTGRSSSGGDREHEGASPLLSLYHTNPQNCGGNANVTNFEGNAFSSSSSLATAPYSAHSSASPVIALVTAALAEHRRTETNNSVGGVFANKRDMIDIADHQRDYVSIPSIDSTVPRSTPSLCHSFSSSRSSSPHPSEPTGHDQHHLRHHHRQYERPSHPPFTFDRNLLSHLQLRLQQK